jgi:Sec-independent protein translocase protein TatA
LPVKKTGLIAVTVVAALLAGCSEGDLRQLGRDTEKALRDAGDALEELAGQAEGPLREATDRAMDAAEEARQASEEFRKNPTTETRQALRRSKRRLDGVSRELEGLLDHAPTGVRSALHHALDSLTELRHRIQRELDSS